MSKCKIVGICLFLFLGCISTVWGGENIVRLKVTNRQSDPLYGVYVVYTQHHVLLATTNEEGECDLNMGQLSSQDTICFSYLGYHDKYIAVNNLNARVPVRLEEKSIFLEEVVAQGISSRSLLENVSASLKRGRTKADIYRYFGNGLYEKITECRGKAVEYRREYGCFLTIGNAKERPAFDYGGRYDFVPRYIARSYPLASNGKDSLYPLYMNHAVIGYDSGNRKLFRLMRNLELHGPLFSETKYYDFQRVEVGSDDYTYQFNTKKSCYRTKTSLYCRGLLVIDRETHRLKSISMDYIEYYLCNAPKWQKKKIQNIPIVSSAEMEFDYMEDGQYYIKSTQLTSYWKDVKDGVDYIAVDPSRRGPGKNQLVEKEAYLCCSYRHIPAKFHEEHRVVGFGFGDMAGYNPQGEYKPEIFGALPELLDSRKAFEDLSSYKCIDDQFKEMSNRPYYAEDYLLSSRWITDKTVFDHNFCKRFKVARQVLLTCFFKE